MPEKRRRQTVITTRCMRCKRRLGTRTVPWKGSPELTSHGLCPSCRSRQVAEARR